MLEPLKIKISYKNFIPIFKTKTIKVQRNFAMKTLFFYLQIDSPIRGTDGFVESEKQNFDAFKGFQFTIEQIFTNKDSVAVFMIFDGN